MLYNIAKTFILLGILSSMLVFLGGLIGGTRGIIFGLILSIFMNGFAYFFSERMVLRMYGAKPMQKEQYPGIYEMVDSLSKKMGIPRPKLWIIPSNIANAFATGRNPSHASVAVTQGILNILDKDELRGVLAHELSHVKNRDILVSTIAATLAGAIGYLAYWLRNIGLWRTHNSQQRGYNPVTYLIAGMLMPIGATLIQLAISRSREYLADESGAHFSQDPLALASALRKLDEYKAYSALNPRDTYQASSAHMFIVHPFFGQTFMTLFSTHPPLMDRIRRLHEISKKHLSE